MALNKKYVDIDGQKVSILKNWRLNPLSTTDRLVLGASLTIANIGLPCFDTTLSLLYFWDGTQWVVTTTPPTPTIWGAIGGNINDQTDLITLFNTKANISSLAIVAFSGDYNDLINQPTIPAAQVNSDWNAVSGVAEILNKPTIYNFTGTSLQYTRGDGTYATFPTVLSAFTNDIGYITGITSGMVTTALGYVPVPNSRTLTINGTAFDLTVNRTWSVGDVFTTGSYANPSWITSLDWSKITGTPSIVTSFNSRTGIVIPTIGDYTAAQVTNAVDTTSSYANPTWITSLAWSKITGTPTTLSGYGITDPVVLTTGSYSNPSWITSLAYSKLTGTPTIPTPGGATTNIQYNNAGAFAGSANLTWDNTNTLFTVTGTSKLQSHFVGANAAGAGLIAACGNGLANGTGFFVSGTYAGFVPSNPTGTSYGGMYIASSSTGEFRWFVSNSFFPTFYSSAAERMRITTAGRILMNTTSDNGVDQLQVNGSGRINGNVGVNVATTNAARLAIAASTTTASNINLATGVAPTTPNNGDIWFDGSNIFIRVGGVTKQFTIV
jgi:hypothetical protein